MRKWQILVSIFVLLVVSVEAKAGDKEDVLAHMAGFYSALDAGDIDAIPWAKHTRYSANGGLLNTFDPVKVKAWIKGGVAKGLTFDIQPSH